MRKAVTLLLATPYVVGGGLAYWLYRKRKQDSEDGDASCDDDAP